jgi:MSHA biogenesis protein MshN
MSLINKVLQDLDRRQALAGAGAGDAAVVQLRPTPNTKGDRRHGLWLVVAILLLAMLGGVGWMTMRLKFKPLATPVPLQPAVPARPSAPAVAPAIAPTPPPSSAVEPSAPTTVDAQVRAPAGGAEQPQAAPLPQASATQAPVAAAPAAVAPAPANPPPAVADTLKLALAIESPPLQTAPQAETKAERPKAEPKTPRLAKEPLQRVLVDKHNRTPSDSGAASNDFRRAMTLANQGRVAEAEPLLAAILKAQPGLANARQVYVSLLLEQGRIEQARRLLEEGLTLAPSHAEFALALARIHASQREYDAALAVMDKADPADAAGSSFQTLRGAVLQRLGRHAEAIAAYQNALRAAPQQAASWLGLAISYEAIGRANEARDAYRHSVDAGPLAPAAREYAEARMRALQ